MLQLSGVIPPAPQSPFNKDIRAFCIGGVNHIVNGRHGAFLANMNDFYIGQAIIRYGEYGEQEWFLLSQLIKPDMVVAEVGTNIGALTVPIAKAVGRNGRVIAIEPQRIIFQYLCANIAYNALTQVETYHCGAGAHSGMMSVPPVDYFNTPLNNFGGIPLMLPGKGEPVEIRTLDDILGDRPVNLIKIDVEGMELDVLRGAKRTIKKNRPILYVENDQPTKSEQIIRIIQHHNYRLFWHAPYLFNVHNYFSQEENVYGMVQSLNMLCIPSEIPMTMENFQEITDPTQHPLKK